MNHLRNVFLFATLLLWNKICFAQNERRDSLMRILPSLHDSARVDCLNSLCAYYSQGNSISIGSIKRDSVIHFASHAYNEAKKLNYFHGIAESLTHKAEAEEIADNFTGMEIFYREAISWYRKTLNKNGLAATYELLGYSLYAQSYYTEAIKYVDSAFELYKKGGDVVRMYQSIGLSACIYYEKGSYEKFFELEKQGLEMAKQNNDDAFCRFQLISIGHLYSYFDDYITALEYYHQACRNLNRLTDSALLGSFSLYIAELFTDLKQYDSAKYYCDFMDTTDPRAKRFYLFSTGRLFYSQDQYEKALSNFLRGLQYNREANDRNQIMCSLNEISKTYLKMGKADKALKYARECLNMAVQTGTIESVKNSFQIISSAHEYFKQYDSSFLYYKKYLVLQDSTLNKKLKGKLIAYKYEQQFVLLNKEKEKQKAELKGEVVLKKILIGSICFLLILIFIIFRNITLKRKNEAHLRELAENELQIQKLEGEKTKAELQQQTSELQMQALRAQMNPHFVFNSLNSIHRFILQNNRVQASEFLTKFSRLIRLILQNSQTSLITLESELESLSLYLDLESLRFDYYFSYNISIAPEMDISMLKVPPLIIQPYVENAIGMV